MKTNKKILLIILFLVVIFGVYVNSYSRDNKITESTVEQKTISVLLKVSDLSIHLSLIPGSSLYDALLSAKNKSLIKFETKEYSGLGVFVTTIGKLTNGNGGNLMYYINDKEASMGISSYIPQDGDIIEWKLK